LFGGQYKSTGELISGTKTRVNAAVNAELSGKGQAFGVIQDAGRLNLPELKDRGDTLKLVGQDFTVNSDKTVKQIDEFRRSNEKLQGNKVDLSDRSLEVLKGGKAGALQPTFNISVYAGDKSKGEAVASEVRGALDRVLKLATK
jgi:hypothetical protein